MLNAHIISSDASATCARAKTRAIARAAPRKHHPSYTPYTPCAMCRTRSAPMRASRRVPYTFGPQRAKKKTTTTDSIKQTNLIPHTTRCVCVCCAQQDYHKTHERPHKKKNTTYTSTQCQVSQRVSAQSATTTTDTQVSQFRRGSSANHVIVCAVDIHIKRHVNE